MLKIGINIGLSLDLDLDLDSDKFALMASRMTWFARLEYSMI